MYLNSVNNVRFIDYIGADLKKEININNLSITNIFNVQEAAFNILDAGSTLDISIGFLDLKCTKSLKLIGFRL